MTKLRVDESVEISYFFTCNDFLGDGTTHEAGMSPKRSRSLLLRMKNHFLSWYVLAHLPSARQLPY